MKSKTKTKEVNSIALDERMLTALQAISDKKATDIAILNIAPVASFADFFIICSGSSTRQTQAIANEVVEKAREIGSRPSHIEGEKTAEWILVDYGDFIVHIFTEASRLFYDLERLWRDAEVVPLPEGL